MTKKYRLFKACKDFSLIQLSNYRVQDMELACSVTKLLYPDLAKMYQTTDQKIERAIRNAIEVSWGRGNDELFEEMFGFCSEYTRPTNSEYIAVVADYIRIKYHLL